MVTAAALLFFLVSRSVRLWVAVALWNGWTWMEMSLPPGWVFALCFGRKGEKHVLLPLWNLLFLLLSLLQHGAGWGR